MNVRVRECLFLQHCCSYPVSPSKWGRLRTHFLLSLAWERQKKDMDFSLQVLSPQGIGDHDKEIWQATCLTYCQVSLTLSLLLLAASSLWLKLTRATALFFGEWRKIALENSKKNKNKKDRFCWHNIHHIHMLIRWSDSILFNFPIKKQLVKPSLILLWDTATLCFFMCGSMMLFKEHDNEYVSAVSAVADHSESFLFYVL